jgi:D-arabinitol dehydrogenase (NADP+)
VNILEDALNYVRRGGKLVVYGVYGNKDRVSWPPVKICESLQSVACLVARH